LPTTAKRARRHVRGTVYDTPAFIGAEGLWSTVRGQLIGDGRPRVPDTSAIVSVLRAETLPDILRRWEMCCGRPKVPTWCITRYRGRRAVQFGRRVSQQSLRRGMDAYGDPAELHEHYKRDLRRRELILSKDRAWRMWCVRPRADQDVSRARDADGRCRASDLQNLRKLGMREYAPRRASPIVIDFADSGLHMPGLAQNGIADAPFSIEPIGFSVTRPLDHI